MVTFCLTSFFLNYMSICNNRELCWAIHTFIQLIRAQVSWDKNTTLYNLYQGLISRWRLPLAAHKLLFVQRILESKLEKSLANNTQCTSVHVWKTDLSNNITYYIIAVEKVFICIKGFMMNGERQEIYTRKYMTPMCTTYKK